MTNRSRVIDETLINLFEPSDIATTVSAARSITRDMGFEKNRQFLIASAVSELATNILRYAGRGQVIIRIIMEGEREGIEVVARDSGPGIHDIEQAMQDHFSGGAGLGLGLPSVKRIMDEFSLESSPGVGTTVTALKWRN
ncbi:anti-sigma regulatory factor [Dethiosulfatarculus sandiegensis]|nr:anti-sigma regulatory factor [Dethiosulfatarculus sandiegensis]